MSKSKNNNKPEDEKDLPEPLVLEELDEWFDMETVKGGTSTPKNKRSLERRQARGIALQTLFESDAVNHTPQDVLDRHIKFDNLPPETAEFATLLVKGVVDSRDKLDNMISTSAPSWPMDQMAKVDKNILRLAIFEILFNNDVPTKAAINEAIELAKNFGSDSSSRFVNGVLGAIVAQNSHIIDEQPG